MITRTTKRRAVMALAIGAVAALALAACSGGSAEPTASGGKTTVKFWSWNPDEATAKPYIDAFEAEHPDITIEHRFIQFSDYVQATQLALTSGSGPDVFGTQVGALTTQFAPLAEDLTPYLEKEVGSDWKDKLTATDQLAVDGQQVGAPWMITGGGLVWANQTLVDSLGLTVPKTAAELKTFCAAVKAAGKDCIEQGAKDAWQNIDVYQSIINQINPGAFYDATAGKASFDTPDFAKAFDVWKGMFDDGLFEDGALGATAYPDSSDKFFKGGAALIVFGSWQNADTTNTRLATYASTYGDESIKDTIFMPYFFPQIVDGGKTGSMFGGPDVGFAVSSASKVKDAAATFALWLSTNEASQKLMAKTVQQPALKSVPLDESDVKTDAQKQALDAQGPALADMIGARQIQNADVQTALGDALSAVASGQTSSADAAKSVDDAIKAAYK
jgi:raffinose/stachyose/melibiose transport system substrate-binding protein